MESRAERDAINSFVLIFAGGKEVKRLCVAKLLFLFRMSGKRMIDGEVYALLQYMECNDLLNYNDMRLECLCRR